MACLNCHNLQPPALQYLGPGKRAVFFISVGDLTASAKDCSECELVLNVLQAYKQDWNDDDKNYSVELGAAKDQPLELFYRREPLYLELLRTPEDDGSVAITGTIGSVGIVAKHSGSEVCSELLSKWIGECRMNHPLCIYLADQQSLPTRVLRVGKDGDSEVSLLLSRGRKGAYVALSYCWGDPSVHKSLTTMKNNIDQHCKGIPLTALPRTIIDAVTVTRQQGFEYLWVDALCIVQDDSDDWACEAARMSLVYNFAALTLVISRSSGSSDGIFGEQLYSRSVELPYKDTTVRARTALSREHAEFRSLDREPWVIEPINKRAWTLQESLLSNRTVFFTSQELRWQCNEWRRCECGTLSGQTKIEDLADLRGLRLASLFQRQTVDDAYRKWEDVIMTFSERSLSFEGDRLPALSGMAQQFAALMKTCFGREEVYLAGIWKDALPRELLWNVESIAHHLVRDKDTHRRRPSKWRAPSWSWASIEAPIQLWPSVGMTGAMKVLEASVTSAGVNHFGQVEFGYLKVRGPMLDNLSAHVIGRTGDGDAAWSLLTQSDIRLCTFVPDFGDLGQHDEAYGLSALIVGHRRIAGTYSALVFRGSGNTADEYARVGIATLGPFRETPLGNIHNSRSGIPGEIWVDPRVKTVVEDAIAKQREIVLI